MRTLVTLLLAGVALIGATHAAQATAAEATRGASLELSGKEDYLIARVVEIRNDVPVEISGSITNRQRIRVRILRGPERNHELVVERGDFVLTEDQKVSVGDDVVIVRAGTSDDPEYFIGGKYRLRSLLWAGVLFLALIVMFGRRIGVRALLGLLLSILVLVKVVIPRIVAGSDPLWTSIIAAGAIAVVSLYLAHGVSRRTSVALMAMIITLGIAGGLAALLIPLARLYGGGTEESFYLQLGSLSNLNLRGLLLGGMIIGLLGVLDDVTTTQVAAVAELKHVDPSLSAHELYARGLSIGREHIASLINTLALAYVGVSFPLLLLFAVNSNVPLWVNVNSELIAEEIIRTIVGSSALILAVPIATFLAARMFTKYHPAPSTPGHAHH